VKALSFRRTIFQIKNVLVRAPKATLLSFVFLFALLGNIVPAFADDTYATYTRLFNNPDPIPANVLIGNNTSSFTKNGWVINKTTKNIIGPRFLFTFAFPEGGQAKARNAEYTWDHIPSSSKDHVFLIRSCDIGTDPGGITEASCIYSDIPYQEDVTSLTSSYLAILAAPFDFGSTLRGTAAINAADTSVNALVILRKDPNGKYIAGANQDVIGTNWYKLTSTGISTETVDWLQKPNQLVSMWYSGVKINGNNGVPIVADNRDPNDGTNGVKDDGTDTVKKWFSGSYFKIGEVTITKPTSYDQAVANSNDVAVNANRSVEKVDDGLPDCSMTGGAFGAGSFMGCVARGIYYVVYWPISWFAGLMGTIFDFFLGYSLSDISYRADFAVRGWQLVRDISNIFFIIILVWTGLSTALSGKNNMKQVVPQLILNALLINFSLFGTRMIIDLSNVVARVFYNQVHVCTGECKEGSDGKIENFLTGPGGYMSLSTKIVSSFKPQTIFNAKVLAKNAQVGNAQVTKKSSDTESDDAGYFIIVTLIAAVIMFGIAMMFWNVAFMFVGRVVGLYMAMIFAPFAVLTNGNMPLVGSFQALSWKKWFSDLTSYALLAPIFVFFLYIIYSFLDTGFLKVTHISEENGFFATVIDILVPMVLIYFMMKQGVDIAKKYAGQFGNGLQDFVNKTVGGVGGLVGGGVGLAAGGAALLGRGTAAAIGQGAKKWGLNTWAAKNAEDNWFARKTNNGLKNIQTSTWDVRNAGIKIGKKEYTAGATLDKGFGLMGAKPSYGFSDALGLSQKKYVGGNLKIQKDRDKKEVEKIEKQLNFDHLSDAEAKEVWKQKMQKSIQEASEKNWAKNITSAEEVAKNSQVYKNLQQKEKDLEADLARSKASGSVAGQTVAEQALTQNKVAQSTTIQQAKDLETNKPEEFQKMRLQAIEDLKKNNNYRDSAAYTTASETEKKRLSEYGEIKDAKTLTSAMRSEYAKGLRENSFWMKDGKSRWVMSPAGGTTAGIFGIGATINTAIDAGIGLIIGAHIKELQNSFDHASKTVSDKHKKTVTGTALAKHQETLDNLNKKLKEELKSNNFLEEIEKANAKDIEDAIIAGIARRNKIIKELEKKERNGGVLDTDEETKLARNQKELSDLKRMETERANIKDKIEVIQNKTREDEEKKKKGDDKPEKPKDETKK
jgi:hypothetical protein